MANLLDTWLYLETSNIKQPLEMDLNNSHWKWIVHLDSHFIYATSIEKE